jgi:predicted RNase H-like nuclease (RuvC/YqgF family)
MKSCNEHKTLRGDDVIVIWERPFNPQNETECPMCALEKEVKDLESQVDEQESEIEDLEDEVEDLESQIHELKEARP